MIRDPKVIQFKPKVIIRDRRPKSCPIRAKSNNRRPKIWRPKFMIRDPKVIQFKPKVIIRDLKVKTIKDLKAGNQKLSNLSLKE